MRMRPVFRALVLTMAGVLATATIDSCTTGGKVAAPASGSSVFRQAIIRLAQQRRFRLHGDFHFLSRPSPTVNFNIHFRAPNSLWARYAVGSAPFGTGLRRMRASGGVLERLVADFLLPRGTEPSLDPGGGVALHHLGFRVSTMTHRVTAITVSARGYPWICYPLYSGCHMPEVDNVRSNSYVGVLHIDPATGLPQRYTSLDTLGGRVHPGQDVTFTYG